MRDFETLIKEAKALQARVNDDASVLWWSSLTQEEQALFVNSLTAILDEIGEIWKRGVAPALEVFLEDKARIDAIWKMWGTAYDAPL